MDRLTGRDAKGVYYRHGGECGVHPYADRPNIEHYAAIERLAAYEDAEEQREKGCEYCNNADPMKIYAVGFTEQLRELSFAGDSGYTEGNSYMKQILYCPICGRKLK